jgi:glucan phosphorylase
MAHASASTTPRAPEPPEAESMASSLRRHVTYGLARSPGRASPYELYLALARAIREPLIERWLATERHYRETSTRRACYLSMEFLMGRMLRNAILALGAEEPWPNSPRTTNTPLARACATSSAARGIATASEAELHSARAERKRAKADVERKAKRKKKRRELVPV